MPSSSSPSSSSVRAGLPTSPFLLLQASLLMWVSACSNGVRGSDFTKCAAWMRLVFSLNRDRDAGCKRDPGRRHRLFLLSSAIPLPPAIQITHGASRGTAKAPFFYPHHYTLGEFLATEALHASSYSRPLSSIGICFRYSRTSEYVALSWLAFLGRHAISAYALECTPESRASPF